MYTLLIFFSSLARDEAKFQEATWEGFYFIEN